LDGSFHVGYDQLVMDFSIVELKKTFATMYFKSREGISVSSLVLDK
jgi:hypothetical protein